MATTRHINSGIIEKTKKTLLIAYKRIVLALVFGYFFLAGPNIFLNLVLNF